MHAGLAAHSILSALFLVNFPDGVRSGQSLWCSSPPPFIIPNGYAFPYLLSSPVDIHHKSYGGVRVLVRLVHKGGRPHTSVEAGRTARVLFPPRGGT